MHIDILIDLPTHSLVVVVVVVVVVYFVLDKIIDTVGEGTFGKVLSCWDRHSRRMVAIKVVRDIKKYQEAAEIEIDILKRLARHDPTNTRYATIYLHLSVFFFFLLLLNSLLILVSLLRISFELPLVDVSNSSGHS